MTLDHSLDRQTPKEHQVHTFCLALVDSHPRIWRRIEVGGQTNLYQLHHVLQAAMGWSDAHLHEFMVGKTRYLEPGEIAASDVQAVDEREVMLDRVTKPGLVFSYRYDFGDSWDHVIKVEQVRSVPEPMRFATVLAGERACPPENCGGIGAYQRFLDEAARSRTSESVRSFLEWAGEDFDPTMFDRHAANNTLLRMAWNSWGR